MANINLTQFMCLTSVLFFIRIEFIGAIEVNVAFDKPTYKKPSDQNDTSCSTSSLAVDDDPQTYTTIPASYWWCVDLQQTVNITRIETTIGSSMYLRSNVNRGCSTSGFSSSSPIQNMACLHIEYLRPCSQVRYSTYTCARNQPLTARSFFMTPYGSGVDLYSMSIFAVQNFVAHVFATLGYGGVVILPQAQCPEGYYSSSRNCVPCNCIIGINCDPDTGYCLQCQTGRYGNVCENNCPNCRHGCQKDNGVCNVTVCSNHTSCVCKDGFYGDKCDEPCSERCLNKTCYAGSPSRPECIEGCVDGYQGPYCQTPCPVNCIKCDQLGDGCSICKSGWYGNKCQLSNYGCIPGKTGADCLSDCNANCTSCRQSNENDCTSCKEGRYGIACNNLCSPACITPIVHKTNMLQPVLANNICHQLTGGCIFGCIVGRKGRNCTKAHYVFTPLSAGLIGASSAVIVVFTICVIICKLYNRRKSPDGANLCSETRKSQSKPRDLCQDLSNTGYVNTSFHNPDTMDHENKPPNCDHENYENLPTEIVQNLNDIRGQQNQRRDKMYHQQPLVEHPRISRQLLYEKVVKKAAGQKPIKRLLGEKTTKAGKKAGQSKVSENRSTEQSLELYENTHIDKHLPKCRQQTDVYVNIH